MAGYELTPEEIKLFLEEAHEQLQIMEERLLALEEDPGNSGFVQEIFRAAHTLKGGSATAGFDNVARLTHAMESVLDQVRQGERVMTTAIADVLLEGVDLLRRCLAEIGRVGNADGVDVEPLIAALEEQAELKGAAQGAPALQGGGQPGRGAAVGGGPAASGAPAPGPAAEVSAGALPPRSPESHPAGSSWAQTAVVEAHLAPSALMSAVRAYQVLLILEDFGDIVSCEPSREAIESGAAEVRSVKAAVRLRTAGKGEEASIEAIRRAVAGVPDVVSVSVAVEGMDGSAPAGSQGQGNLAGLGSGAEAAAPAAAAPKPAPEAAAKAAGGAASAGVASLGQTIRVDVAVLDNLMNLVGELVIDRTRLAQLALLNIPANQLREELTSVSSSLSRITSDLQDAIMHARMMPVDTLFKKFPRMIRDLSRQLGKEIDFEMSGNETELDRSVIEQIGDPLIHLLRNAVDHGIEPAEERRRAGKPERGVVRLHAFHQESHIYIQVSDDGRGLDREKILRKAVERGLIRPEEAGRMSREQIYELIFSPGFTTASEVSSVSGRGVGLDVVRRNLEKVNGSVTVTSEEGKGTTFTIKLPLTLVIVQALLVEIAGCVMAIPLSNVTEAVQVTPADVHFARGWELIAVRGEMVPLLNPGAVWGERWAVEPPAGKPAPVVILRSGGSPLALRVNRLLGEQEIVIKALGPVIGNVPGISGASILGDGRVALIIDAAGLSKAVTRLDRTA